jgi:uncharacterized membrane protein YphA (DoxX/SURF4 family)
VALTWKQRLAGAGRWGLQVLLAGAFVSIGIGKFTSTFWAGAFERWGYPPGFHLVTGVIEMGLGLILLIPRVASYAALALGGVMLAAIATHALAGQPWTRPLPHLTLLLVLAVVRWRARWRPGTASPVSDTAAVRR